MDINILYILAISLFLGTACLLYGKYRCMHPEFEDPLQNQSGFWDIDGWSAIHIAQFTFLGFLFPAYFIFIMGIGLAWEGMEFLYESRKLQFFQGFGHCVSTDQSPDKVWWYGKVSDIFSNLLGFGIGYFLRYYV
jgi:hypothetical protein